MFGFNARFMALDLVMVMCNAWNKTPESIFLDYTRPVRYFRSARVSLLLLIMSKIQGTGASLRALS